MKKKNLNERVPHHVAIILDGNGRWAKRKRLPRTAGHKKGAENLKTIALAAQEAGVCVLSVYAFSTENWKRPRQEVDYLMELPASYEKDFSDDFKAYDIRVIFSGRRDRLSDKNRELMSRVEEKTKDRKSLLVNVCFDYGSRDEIIAAANACLQKGGPIDEAAFEEALYTHPLPHVDLLIRPGGEKRLSNYLLWQSAYAELYFTRTLWPDFTPRNLRKAIAEYASRTRKFGGLTE